MHQMMAQDAFRRIADAYFEEHGRAAAAGLSNALRKETEVLWHT